MSMSKCLVLSVLAAVVVGIFATASAHGNASSPVHTRASVMTRDAGSGLPAPLQAISRLAANSAMGHPEPI